MAFGALRRYEVQAKYAVVLSLISMVPFLAAVTLVFRNYDHALGQIVYGSTGKFLPTFAACVGLSMMPGAIGFVLGWNSAGQRRNDRPAWSWIGFFVGGGVVTLDVVLLIAFLMLRLERPM